MKEHLIDSYGSHGWDGFLGDWLVLREAQIPKADLEAAVATLRKLDRSTPADETGKELVRLKVLTAGRGQEADDLKYQIAIIAEELSAYPPDVVRQACRNWSANSKWFPTWHELKEECEHFVRVRRNLRAKLERRLAEGRYV